MEMMKKNKKQLSIEIKAMLVYWKYWRSTLVSCFLLFFFFFLKLYSYIVFTEWIRNNSHTSRNDGTFFFEEWEQMRYLL